MTGKVCQGDILKIERIQQDVLVVSKDFFHSSGEISVPRQALVKNLQ